MNLKQDSKGFVQRFLYGNIFTQIIVLVLGVISSILLVFLGLLQESPLEIISAPLFGLFQQVLWFTHMQFSPIAILICGSAGFVGLLALPGFILTFLLYDDMDLATRLLLGTGTSILLVFFPVSYGLIFAIAPSPALLLIPLLVSTVVGIWKPSVPTKARYCIVENLNWLKNDISRRKTDWFWIVLLFFFFTRVALFSLTDSYSSDSLNYASYADDILKGTLLSGRNFTHPIGYALISIPFVWLAGSIPWGLSLASWCLGNIALFAFVPILKRMHDSWPTARKPPYRLVLLIVFTVPWLTILISGVFYESTLLFFTLLGATAGSRIEYSEIWVGLASGVGYLIRPTHAIMYFVFMLSILLRKGTRASEKIIIGLHSCVVALPVIPKLIRNIAVEGQLISIYDAKYIGLDNVPRVIYWIFSFITHSDDGVFSLLFAFALIPVTSVFLSQLPEYSLETLTWLALSFTSVTVFLMWPTDQPRFYAFFIWMIPLIMTYELWSLNWDSTVWLLLAWQISIFGAIPFSPQGWIIQNSSSWFGDSIGVLRVYPQACHLWVYVGYLILLMLWAVLIRHRSKYPSRQSQGTKLQ